MQKRAPSKKAEKVVEKTDAPKIESRIKTSPEIETSPITAGEIGSENNLLDFDQEGVLKGIIFSEILGKPKSRRTGR